MQDFNKKSLSEKAKVVSDALVKKHAELNWYVVCYKNGGSWHSIGGSILWFRRDGLWFLIVAMHDKANIDKLI
jgi:hypothetical protein